jgi:hypothetical protein
MMARCIQDDSAYAPTFYAAAQLLHSGSETVGKRNIRGNCIGYFKEKVMELWLSMKW